MRRQERTGDATLGGRMDEDELLAIATEEGFGDDEPAGQEQAAREEPERQQPSRH